MNVPNPMCDKLTESKITKNKFTPEEDMKLLSVVNKLGPKHWKVIASFINGRNARQCKDRYNNYWRPDLIFQKWTQEEDFLLVQKYFEIGPKWSQISTYFKGRSGSSLKNRWYSIISYQINSKKVKKAPISVVVPELKSVVSDMADHQVHKYFDWDEMFANFYEEF